MRTLTLIAFAGAVAATSVMMSPPPLRVVFFGDSITEAGVGPTGYITQLREMLPRESFDLIGAGVGGNKIYDLYLRMDRDVLGRSPDVVVVFVGVNDVWHKRSFGTGTDPDKFVAFYDAIIAKLQEKGIRVILATPALIGEKTDCSNDLDGELNHYAQLIRNVAAAHHCALVDLRSEFLKTLAAKNTANAEKGILTVDGVHFTPEGNALAAELFRRALTAPR
ncbi:MAG TPA: GDSL-type esterase/lipase family protein [Bacteroidota bacterium]|nr:GDSL-type esterase/lipase family protein [Bacteroidota bacterium]